MERAIDLDPGVTHYHRWLVNHYKISMSPTAAP